MSYPIIGSYTLQKEYRKQRIQNPVHIYYLCDPEDGVPRYVGRTVDPIGRLKQHKWGFGCGHEFYVWMKRLRESDSLPRMDVVEIVSPDEALIAEQRWIERLTADGFDLLNAACCRRRKHTVIDGSSATSEGI